jgi:hypothetical protein
LLLIFKRLAERRCPIPNYIAHIVFDLRIIQSHVIDAANLEEARIAVQVLLDEGVFDPAFDEIGVEPETLRRTLISIAETEP